MEYKQDVIKMRNPFQIFSFYHRVDYSKIHKKFVR